MFQANLRRKAVVIYLGLQQTLIFVVSSSSVDDFLAQSISHVVSNMFENGL